MKLRARQKLGLLIAAAVPVAVLVRIAMNAARGVAGTGPAVAEDPLNVPVTVDATALAGVALPRVHAAGSDAIQVALIGCGGRGTGAAPVEFSDHVGAPLQEGLLLVHNTLVGVNLRDRIKIGCAGKIVSAFDIARAMALGADWCNAARGFMFALGCIQSQSCHTDRCPTGIATQDPNRQAALDPDGKAVRVANFHRNTLVALKELLAAAGLRHPLEIGPEHIIRRVSSTEVRSLAKLHHFVRPGELLETVPDHPVFQVFWDGARPDRFAPPPEAAAMLASKLR